MAMLSSADIALLYGAGSVRIAQHRLIIDPEIHEHSTDPFTIGIRPDHAGKGNTRAERSKQCGDAARTAESFLALVGVQENDWRLLTDALGITPDIAVEHDIANHQNARLAKVIYQVRKVAVAMTW
jgi:hypothetical protein